MVRCAARLASRPRTVTRRAGLATELAGIAKGRSPIAPQRRDQRFSDRAWSGNPLLRRTMQTYLALAQDCRGPARRRRTGLARQHAAEVRADQPDRRIRAEQQPVPQPGGTEGVHRHRRPEPRPRDARVRLRHDLLPAHPHHGEARRVPGRQGPRGDPGIGGGPHRGLRAHPVPAGHAHRARVPAAHGPADDQQVLHHRHRARPQHDRVLRLPGIPGIRDRPGATPAGRPGAGT